MIVKWRYILSILASVYCLQMFGYSGKQDFIARRVQKVRKKREVWDIARAERNHRPWHRNRPPSEHRLTHMLGNFGRDVLLIHKNIFSWDSYKILLTTFPLFIGSRMIDEKLQNHFFDPLTCKNINEPPKWCRELARWSIGIPIGLLGIKGLLSRDEELHTTTRVFLTGMPFVLFAKDLIKKFKFEACLRPRHEKFSTELEDRVSGGFPSGHVAEATYTAVMYGMRYGPKFAVPLGGIAAFVGVNFLACNRHYLSQLIAGAGFGAMYAVAANKLVDSKLAQDNDLNFNISVNESGGPTLSLSLRF